MVIVFVSCSTALMLYCVEAETADKGGREKGARSWALALAELLAQTAERLGFRV